MERFSERHAQHHCPKCGYGRSGVVKHHVTYYHGYELIGRREDDKIPEPVPPHIAVKCSRCEFTLGRYAPMDAKDIARRAGGAAPVLQVDGGAGNSPAEPGVMTATVCEADGDWIPIECRTSGGQKGALVQVNAAFPDLAQRIAGYLTSMVWVVALDVAGEWVKDAYEIENVADAQPEGLSR